MVVLYVILAVVIVFLCVLLFNVARVNSSARKLGENVDWKSEEEQLQYAKSLAKMIQCKTVSENGKFDDTEFSKLRDVVRELLPIVHEKAELKIFGDDCWIYKIEGKDTSRNIMLMSHHDVVKADGKWAYPPFEAKIVDKKYGVGVQ